MSDKIITHELLKSWSPCTDRYRRFCELLPEGGALKDAIDALVKDGRDDLGYWLFSAARKSGQFESDVAGGYRNSGGGNSGGWNSGDGNSGDWNSGHRNSGDWNSGHRNSGDWNSGDGNSGDRNSGDWNSGHRNSGGWNSGDWNSGNWNSGNWNSGHRNSGDGNSGDGNSGDWNSGHRNSGERNSGDGNSGDWNSGYWNSGHWNSGYFNSITPETILVFNKQCLRADWNAAEKPDFIFKVTPCYWVDESEMSDADKARDPDVYVRGGQLRKRGYKEAWALAYAGATPEEVALLKALPNFDADVFEEITGIRVE